MKIAATTLLLFGLISNVLANSRENLFYLTPDIADAYFSTAQLQQIKVHAKSITILAPQIYQFDDHGILWGSIDPKLLDIAKENNIKVMPLIINQYFSQEKLHALLNNPNAQETVIAGMLSLCEHYHFYGLQFDVENISLNDKKEFTHFFQLAADRLHQHKFIISIAVIPHTADTVYTNYDRWYFENWSGAYDYQALGKSADFVSIMSYDRHTSLTTPGPLAAADWVEKTIQAILKDVPAQKVSLGVPDYSGYWSNGILDSDTSTGKYIYRSKEMQISYPKVLVLLGQFNQAPIWQNQWQSSYAMFSNHERNEFLFVEDAKSFKAKTALADRYHLRGISVWKLGLEDPAIWDYKK